MEFPLTTLLIRRTLAPLKLVPAAMAPPRAPAPDVELPVTTESVRTTPPKPTSKNRAPPLAFAAVVAPLLMVSPSRYQSVP